MRISRALIICSAFGVVLAGVWFLGIIEPKLYAARGTFYYWLPGLEHTAGFSDCSGPSPFGLFKEELWDKRPDDYEQRVLRQLIDSYGVCGEDNSDATSAIRSIAFCRTRISRTWQELIAVSRDPVLAAHVANAAMDILREIDVERQESIKEEMVRQLVSTCERIRESKKTLEKQMKNCKVEDKKSEYAPRIAELAQCIDRLNGQISLYQEMDARTNAMFKIMIPAGVATNVLTRRIARRLRDQPEAWSPWQ